MKFPHVRFQTTARFASGLFALAVLASIARSEVTELDVGVRSTAEGWPKITKAEAAARAEKTRSQTYGILQVAEIPGGGEKLVKPVDAMVVAKALEDELKAQGFVKMKPKTKPEILITGEYGRGWLKNPFQSEQTSADSETTGAPVVNITDMSQLMRQKENGYEAKLQKANYEKLYIRVKAWKYPTSPKEKPELIWTTVMVVDDPDNRDLNGALKDMLAAGGPFFGHPVDKPEVDVYKPLPVGRVDVGPATVVSDKEKK